MILYDYTISNYKKNLTNMKAILAKAETWAKEKGMTEEALLQSRLAPDQFPFVKQIQVMTDSAKSSGALLANVEVPSYPDTEVTVAELQERLSKTIAFLETIKPELIDESTLDTRTMSLRWMPGKGLTVYNHSAVYALPNFFFHYVTAYSILRNLGLDIGKADYMGGLPLIDVA